MAVAPFGAGSRRDDAECSRAESDSKFIQVIFGSAEMISALPKTIPALLETDSALPGLIPSRFVLGSALAIFDSATRKNLAGGL